MADERTTNAARALLSNPDDSDDGRYWPLYSGTRDELIAAGLGEPGDFPGDPCGPIASRVVKRNGKRLHISVHSRVAKPMTYWVEVSKAESREERQQRRAREKAERQVEYERNNPEFWRGVRERKEQIEALKRAIRADEDVGIVRREDDAATEWTGRRADLVATKICVEAQFPEGRKHYAYGDQFVIPTPNAERWSIRRIALDCYSYVVHWSAEDTERRRKAGIGSRPIPRPPSFEDAGRFADWCEDGLSLLAKLAIKQISGEYEGETYGDCTIRYDGETVRRVADALDHARQVLQAATPLFVGKKQSQEAKAARVDPDFRRFISKIAPK